MFFLFILIILIFVLAIYTSKIQIDIENLKIDTEAENIINKENKINVNLLIFGKVKLFKKDGKSIKLLNNNMDIKILEDKNIEINYKELIQNINIVKVDLYAQISTQDAAFTAIIVGIISALLGIIIRKPKFEIIPIYSNKNFLKINLDGIFSIYLRQYIYKLISNKLKDLKNKFFNKKVEV